MDEIQETARTLMTRVREVKKAQLMVEKERAELVGRMGKLQEERIKVENAADNLHREINQMQEAMNKKRCTAIGLDSQVEQMALELGELRTEYESHVANTTLPYPVRSLATIQKELDELEGTDLLAPSSLQTLVHLLNPAAAQPLPPPPPPPPPPPAETEEEEDGESPAKRPRAVGESRWLRLPEGETERLRAGECPSLNYLRETFPAMGATYTYEMYSNTLVAMRKPEVAHEIVRDYTEFSAKHAWGPTPLPERLDKFTIIKADREYGRSASFYFLVDDVKERIVQFYVRKAECDITSVLTEYCAQL